MSEVFGDVYRNKRVFLTGHTGFKGSWMALWLHALGAKVTGYALPPPTTPSLFDLAGIGGLITHIEGDIRDARRLREAVAAARPHAVFHLAAQSLVRRSYEDPIETLETNVMGTAQVLEAVRVQANAARPCAVVVVTSDKCYENQEWVHGYRESDPMGGHDPYSMSKGATELVVASWRRSFASIDRIADHGLRLASVRAGNVIGGGDWAGDRIVTDCVASLRAGVPIRLRNPRATRPWQHVLEPLSGYLDLGARLMTAEPGVAGAFAEGWNFGPPDDSVWPVSRMVEEFVRLWGHGRWEDCSDPGAPHEATLLALSTSKAFHRLGWWTTWDVRRALAATVAWFREYDAPGVVPIDLTMAQIEAFVADARRAGIPWAGSTPTRETS